VYKTKNGHAFQDGGLNENNPVGLAVKEAPYLWADKPQLDIALSIGTGFSEKSSDKQNLVATGVVRSWLWRCVDSFENKLDSERLWREYHATLNEDERRRHHRLNVELPGVLPFMADTGAIEQMDKQTRYRFQNNPDARSQLRSAAEALLASLFYVTVERGRMTSLPHNKRFVFRAQISCRLERQHQRALLERLQDSNCSFLVHGRVVGIDFLSQISRVEKGELFRQDVQWDGGPRDTFHIYLVFGGDTIQGHQGLDRSTTTANCNTGTAAAKHEISCSPVTRMRT
jgi:hypothetical protein